MMTAGFPPGIETWKHPAMPADQCRPRSAPWAPLSLNKLDRLKGGNTFTSLGCPYTEPLVNPLVANTKPQPPPVKRLEARRAIKLARMQQGKQDWRALSKTERATVARQLVLTERAIAALPPMPPPVLGRAARNTAPVIVSEARRGAQTERAVSKRVSFRVDEGGFSTAQLRGVDRNARAVERRQGTVEYETTTQGEYLQRDFNPILARPPGGERGLYNKPAGIFTDYIDRSIKLNINIHDDAGSNAPGH